MTKTHVFLHLHMLRQRLLWLHKLYDSAGKIQVTLNKLLSEAVVSVTALRLSATPAQGSSRGLSIGDGLERAACVAAYSVCADRSPSCGSCVLRGLAWRKS